MKELNMIEVEAISGGRIRPSEWTWSAAAGALVGSAVMSITAFSAAPIAPLVALTVGPAIGVLFHATYDILHEYDL